MTSARTAVAGLSLLGLVAALSGAPVSASGVATPTAGAGAPTAAPIPGPGAALLWTEPGTYSYPPAGAANAALVVAVGGGGAGTRSGSGQVADAAGGGGAIVTSYLPIPQQPSPWTVVVGGAGAPGGPAGRFRAGSGGGGSSGVYPGGSATAVVAGGGGGAGGTRSGPPGPPPIQGSLQDAPAPQAGGSGGNPDGSGAPGAGPAGGVGGSNGNGGSGGGSDGSGGGNGSGGPGGSAWSGGGGGFGPAFGGVGGSADSEVLGAGGGGGSGGGGSGGGYVPFTRAGGGGGAGGSSGPSPAGFPQTVFESAAGAVTGTPGSILIATVAPAVNVTATAVANGSLAIDWDQPAQFPGLGPVTYQALVNGQAVLSQPGVVDGLDPLTPASVTVLASAGPLTGLTGPVSTTPSVTPTVTAVTPASGSTAGNYSVAIQGTNFLAPATVQIAGANATDVSVQSPSLITATIPGGIAGPAAVSVTNSSTGLSGSATDLFAYFVPGPPVVAPSIAGLSIAGTPALGNDLVAQVATTGDPAPTVSYQWSSGPDPSGPWTPIDGATGAGFTPGAAQLGQFLQLAISAANGALPNATGTARTATPIQGSRAQLGSVGTAGAAQVGQPLRAVVHGVRGVPAPTVSFQWQVQTESGWQAIPNATAATFTPTAAQVDQSVRARVTVDNGVGPSVTDSTPPSAPVRGSAPSIDGVSVTGEAAVAATLTAAPGLSAGIPAPRLSYQWQVGGGGAGTWSDLAGADSAALEVPDAAAGQSVRVVVRARNGVDPRAWTVSEAVPVAAIPARIGRVSIAGTVQLGRTLRADALAVTGAPTPTLTYRWQRRPGNQGPWSTIAQAVHPSLKVRSGWYLDRLRVRVTATQPSGARVHQVSAQTPRVRAARPSIRTLSPTRGPARGGALVTIRGSGFQPLARVRIGGARCIVQRVRTTQLSCRTSPRRPGTGAVIVRNRDGRDAVLAQSYRYTRSRG